MFETLYHSNLFVMAIPFVIGMVLGCYVIPRMMLVSVKNHWANDEMGSDASTYKAIQIAGLSLFPVLLITLCSSLMVPMCLADNELAHTFSNMVPRILQLVSGMAFLFIAGLKYDMHGSSSLMRMGAIVLASCLFPASHIWINDLHGFLGIHELPFWLGSILTVVCSAYIVLMFRLLDGLDGLASSVGVAILAILLCVCGCSAGYTSGYTPCIVASGTLATVLVYWLMKIVSRKWAKTLMGNSGSYILGYIVAYLVIVISRRSGSEYLVGGDMIVLAAVILPATDIIRVIGSRVREGRSLVMPDKNQLLHLLYRTGLSRYASLAVVMLLPVLYSMVAYLILPTVSNTGLVAVLALMVWATHIGINYFIRRYQTKTHQTAWNKVYGEDAWNANVPVEKIRAKQVNFGTMGMPAHYIQGQELEFLPDGMSALERNVKRLCDMVVSGVCLVVFSPLFLLSYILIKLDDGGPAIFKQERIGRFGRPFNIYKFRSMRLDAEKMGPQLSHAGGDDDPRLTKCGRFLRAHHLDELPQLWNVFCGEMALIGYRPERKFYIDQIMEHDPRYAFLYQIRPGVTSYATLYNGYTDTMEKMLRRLEYDLYYLSHRSWWLDMKVLFLTFTNIVFGKKF